VAFATRGPPHGRKHRRTAVAGQPSARSRPRTNPTHRSPERDTARIVPWSRSSTRSHQCRCFAGVDQRSARPVSARKLGKVRLARWLKSRGVRKADVLAERIVSAAQAQHHELPAAEVKDTLVAEIASEILRNKERLAALEARLEELLAANPKGNILRTLPGMGVVLSAEFLAEVGDLVRLGSADQLAAAAGLAPVLRSSGAITYQRRARRANKALKQVFYRSAFCALSSHETSKAFYQRKREEGKHHHQAVLALARRRVNVLWAMLRDGKVYREQTTSVA
jgi:transposase